MTIFVETVGGDERLIGDGGFPCSIAQIVGPRVRRLKSPGRFRVMRPGAFVRCAVTGAAIPLEELRYWSVDLQEAYSSPEAVLQRHANGYGRKP